MPTFRHIATISAMALAASALVTGPSPATAVTQAGPGIGVNAAISAPQAKKQRKKKKAGRLTVRLAGDHLGQKVTVTVTGRGKTKKVRRTAQVATSFTFKRLKPGRYLATGAAVADTSAQALPTPARVKARVKPGRKTTVLLSYKATPFTKPPVTQPVEPPVTPPVEPPVTPTPEPKPIVFTWGAAQTAWKGPQGSVTSAKVPFTSDTVLKDPKVLLSADVASRALVSIESVTASGSSGVLSLRVSINGSATGNSAGTLTLMEGATTVSSPLPVTLTVTKITGIPKKPQSPSDDRVTKDSGQLVVNDELVVGLRFEATDPGVIAAGIAKDIGATIIGSVPSAKVYQMRFPRTALDAVKAKIPAIEAMPDVAFVSLNTLAEPEAAVPNDPLSAPWDTATPAGNNWNLEYVNAPKAWDTTTGSTAIEIAVIDGDMDGAHGDLAGNSVNSTRGNTAYNGHGTHVAGTICAKGNNNLGVVGMMWTCKLRYYAAGDALTTMSQMMDAVDDGADIVNMSLQYIKNNTAVAMTPELKALADQTNDIFGRAVLYAQRNDKEVLWVLAAGNESQRDVEYTAPGGLAARFPTTVMAVAATDGAGDLAWFSNTGPLVSVAAPGVDIYSTLPRTGCWLGTLGCTDNYGTKSGTSMAAPLVAGLAGLVKAADPSRTAAEIKTCIVAAANGFGHAVPGHPFSVVSAPEAVACESDLDLPATVDVVLSFDLTGSMGEEIDTAKEQAKQAITEIRAQAPETDFRFAVTSYEDYPGDYDCTACGSLYADTYGGSSDRPFRVVTAFTANATTVQNAINTMALGYGSDSPESYARSLWELAQNDTMTTMGYRSDALKVVVNFSDDVPHDTDLNYNIGDPTLDPSDADTGIDPGRDGIVSCGGDDLDFQDDTLSALKAKGIRLLQVDSSYASEYEPYWRSWAALTGGGYTRYDSARPLSDVLIELLKLAG